MDQDSVSTRAELRRRNGDTVMLAFSRGKDAIGAWLALRDDGFDVIPVHYETIPGLSFVAESLAYYERFFGTQIISLPHPAFFQCVDSLTFCPPHLVEIWEDMDLHRQITYRDIYDDVAALKGCGPWYATGVRASDSLTRRMSLRTHGALIESEHKAHVIWDWSAQRLRDEIKRAGVKLPVDYKMFGRSFDGFGIEYLSPLKKRFPDDYARVMELFPLAELEVFRDEQMRGGT